MQIQDELDQKITDIISLQSTSFHVYYPFYYYHVINLSHIKKVMFILPSSIVTSIRLYDICLGDPMIELVVYGLLYDTKVTELYLSNNKIKNIKPICHLLDHNSTLTSLLISCNPIGDEGYQHLATSLPYCSLRELYLHNPQPRITNVGVQTIMESICYNETITDLTCFEMIDISSYLLRNETVLTFNRHSYSHTTERKQYCRDWKSSPCFQTKKQLVDRHLHWKRRRPYLLLWKLGNHKQAHDTVSYIMHHAYDDIMHYIIRML
jgi:hypothetical protein